jgi:hypothetical protein
MKRVTVTAFLLVSAAGFLRGQDVRFEAGVDRNPVGVGEQLRLTFTLSNAGMSGGKNLKVPDLSKFRILSGPNQSSSMQIINGAVSSTISYSYVLQPKEIGTFTIGAASVESGGATYQTQPLQVEVVKAATAKKPQQQSGDTDLTARIGENLFLKAVVDKDHVIQGEQINLVYKLYTRVSIQNYAIEKVPALTGFWGEEVEEPKNVELSTETVDGKQFRVGVIRRMALFPTQSGILEISPMEVQTVVQVQDRRAYDPFDNFFRDPFGRTANYAVRTEAIRIKVDPLPPGAPAGFKGAVGRFTMSAEADRNPAKANEPVTLKIVISGTGNIKVLETPVVELPPDFERYSPKVSENISRKAGLISGSKTVEHLLIPRYPGSKTIKPVVFAYFDLVKRAYVTLTSPPIALVVEPGTTPSGPVISSAPREGVQLLSEDIRFIKVAAAPLGRRGDRFYSSPLFIALVLLPVCGFAGAYVYVRRKEAERTDVAGFLNRQAMKVAQKGLKRAESLLSDSGKQTEFYDEIARALWKYLRDKLGVAQAEISVDRVISELVRRGAGSEVTAALKKTLETCEMARYAPASPGTEAMRATYDEARTIIMGIEKVLRAR